MTDEVKNMRQTDFKINSGKSHFKLDFELTLYDELEKISTQKKIVKFVEQDRNSFDCAQQTPQGAMPVLSSI